MLSAMRYEMAKRVPAYTMYIEEENKKKYVLSKYDPIAEAEKIVGKIKGNKETLWVVLGYCMGYLIEEIISVNGQEAHILILEPDKDEYTKQEKYRMEQGKEQVKYPNVHIYAGSDIEEATQLIIQKLRLENMFNIEVVYHQVYRDYHLNYYEKIVKIITSLRKETIINQNTIEKMTNQVLKNNLINRKYIEESYDIRQHKDAYSNIPAVVVSAGPSLSKNIHHLKDFKGLIFVVGRALEATLRQGITPDFIGTLDPQDITYDTFKGHTKTEIPLIALSSANHKIIEDARGPLYFVDYMAKELIATDLEELPIGGSVATLCASAAQYMGCSPIILVGQDLAYTEMKYHAEDCVIHAGGNQVEVAKKGLKLVEGFDGNQVYSNDIFLSYKLWFEQFIAAHAQTRFINATEGGVLIKGADHMALEQAINPYVDNKKILVPHQDKVKLTCDIDDHINNAKKQFEKLKEIATKALKYAKELKDEYIIYKGSRNKKIDDILIKMEKADQLILELEKNMLVAIIFNKNYGKYCMDTQYHERLGESKYEQGLRVSQLNCELYRSLVQGSQEILDIIEQTKSDK